MVNRQAALVGGTVIDGTGSGAYPATVIVSNGRVLEIIGQQNSIPSDAEIFDCTGLMIAPGFIDTHSHADNAPLLLEDDVSKIEQGVTTEVTGNCGFSLAPIEPMNREAAHTLLSRIFPPTELPWGKTTELFDAMEDKGLVTNHAPLVGHNVLRIAAMGADGRHADRDELQQMVAALESALDAGAFGLSSGLIYPPGLFSDPSELSALTKVLGKQRIYATHMRNESSRVFESISESLSAVGKRCRLHVSHVKIADSMQWGHMNEIMAALDEARERGQSVFQDAYPYSAGSTMLTAALPRGSMKAESHQCSPDSSLQRLSGRHVLIWKMIDPTRIWSSEAGTRSSSLARALTGSKANPLHISPTEWASNPSTPL